MDKFEETYEDEKEEEEDRLQDERAAIVMKSLALFDNDGKISTIYFLNIIN